MSSNPLPALSDPPGKVTHNNIVVLIFFNMDILYMFRLVRFFPSHSVNFAETVRTAE